MKILRIVTIILLFLLLQPNSYVLANSSSKKKVSDNFIMNQFLLDAHLQPTTVEQIQVTPKSDTKKVVYLTFDDGPNQYTTDIIDVLHQYHIQATFFLLGSNVLENGETTRKIVREGHAIGLHSMSHDHIKLYAKNPKHLLQELYENYYVILSATGVKTKLVRVPYGSKPYMTKPFRDALKKEHYKMWDWTLDSQDWMLKNEPFDLFLSIVNRIQHNREIILFHDSKQTLAVLPLVIEYLKEQGYTFLPYNASKHFSFNFWEDEDL